MGSNKKKQAIKRTRADIEKNNAKLAAQNEALKKRLAEKELTDDEKKKLEEEQAELERKIKEGEDDLAMVGGEDTAGLPPTSEQSEGVNGTGNQGEASDQNNPPTSEQSGGVNGTENQGETSNQNNPPNSEQSDGVKKETQEHSNGASYQAQNMKAENMPNRNLHDIPAYDSTKAQNMKVENAPQKPGGYFSTAGALPRNIVSGKVSQKDKKNLLMVKAMRVSAGKVATNRTEDGDEVLAFHKKLTTHSDEDGKELTTCTREYIVRLKDTDFYSILSEDEVGGKRVYLALDGIKQIGDPEIVKNLPTKAMIEKEDWGLDWVAGRKIMPEEKMPALACGMWWIDGRIERKVVLWRHQVANKMGIKRVDKLIMKCIRHPEGGRWEDVKQAIRSCSKHVQIARSHPQLYAQPGAAQGWDGVGGMSGLPPGFMSSVANMAV